MPQANQLIVSQDLAEFFHHEVAGARAELGVELPDLTEYYLVQLLCDFSRQDGPQTKARREPLALMYSRALELEDSARLHLLKEMGDVALYTSGFFTDSIERELVDIDYYIAMGGNAYQSLSCHLQASRRGRSVAQMYAQMASGFTQLVDVLGQVAAKSQARNPCDTDLLKLYDRWTRTGSERLRRLLRERGLLPTPDLPHTFDQ